jgi:hypothetical protein
MWLHQEIWLSREQLVVKSETLGELAMLVQDEGYTVEEVREEIVWRSQPLIFWPDGTRARKYAQTPAIQAELAAYEVCAKILVMQKPCRIELGRRLVGAMMAVWPRDYWIYRMRNMHFERHRMPLENVEPFLGLAAWYALVDALQAEYARCQEMGLPVSRKAVLMERELLRGKGEQVRGLGGVPGSPREVEGWVR